MSITFGFAIYFILWWLVLFTVLPFNVQSQAESGEVVPGTEAGAPTSPQLGRKVLITTVVSAGIFGFLYSLAAFGLVDYGRLFFGRT